MKAYALDANAMIRFLNRTADSHRVKALFDLAADGKAKHTMSVVNWGEVIYIVAKRVGIANVVRDLKTLNEVMETIDVDEGIAEEAATLKYNYKLGYGDSFAAALAIRMNATLVTADPDFAKLGKRLKLMPLQRHNG